REGVGQRAPPSGVGKIEAGIATTGRLGDHALAGRGLWSTYAQNSPGDESDGEQTPHRASRRNTEPFPDTTSISPSPSTPNDHNPWTTPRRPVQSWASSICSPSVVRKLRMNPAHRSP